MKIDGLIFWGWIDMPDTTEITMEILCVPFSKIRHLYKLSAQLIKRNLLEQLIFAVWQAGSYCVSRYFGRGIYSFGNTNERNQFIYLISEQLREHYETESIMVYPDTRCDRNFNLSFESILSKHFVDYKTINYSQDYNFRGRSVECLMLNLEKDSVPDHAFAYDSGVV